MNFPKAFRWTSVAALLIAATACQKSPETPASPSAPQASPIPATPKLVSAEPSSFDAVARHLDAGGGMYFYLSTESFLKSAGAKIAEFKPLVMAAAKLNEADKVKAESAWKSIAEIARNSGLNEISGFGASSIALEPGYYQTKWMVHHYEGKGNGVIWKLSGSHANARDLVSYLPAHTATAGSWNLTLEPVWNALTKEGAANPDLNQAAQALSSQLEQTTGLKLSNLLASVGPNYSVVLTLNEDRKVTVPFGGKGETIVIPEPALALMIQVQDQALIDRMEAELAKVPMMVNADQPDLKMRMIPVPVPFPFFRPALAWSKGLVILSTNELLVREMFDVKAGKKAGIAAAPEFKKLMGDLPAAASQFQFTAPIFQKTVMDIQLAATAQQPATGPAVQEVMQYFAKIVPQRWMCGIVQDTPEGWFGISRGGGGAPSEIMAVAAVCPAAVAAAIAAPNFTRAKSRSEATRILEEARLIDSCVDQWAIEHNKKAGEQPTTSDIKAYLKAGSPLWNSANSNPGQTSIAAPTAGLPNLLIPAVDSTRIIPAAISEKFRDTCPPEFWKPYLGDK
ncbi:MAG: hypothetical protein WCP06_13975 [Verrucomicrobiota bacterium]